MSKDQEGLGRIEADKRWRELGLSTDFEAGDGSKDYFLVRESKTASEAVNQ